MFLCDNHWKFWTSFPADTDVFKTSSGRLKKVTMSYDQTGRPQDVWQETSYLRRLEDVGFTSSWRHRIYDVLKTSDLRRLEDICFTTSWRRRIYVFLKASDLRCLEDVWFTTSWRCRIYVFLKTSDLRCFEDVCFTTSWRRLIYVILRTSVERRLCSNIVATSTQRRNKWFFLILYCLKYSESFKCFCLGWYLGMKFCKLLRFFNHTCKQILQNH